MSTWSIVSGRYRHKCGVVLLTREWQDSTGSPIEPKAAYGRPLRVCPSLESLTIFSLNRMFAKVLISARSELFLCATTAIFFTFHEAESSLPC